MRVPVMLAAVVMLAACSESEPPAASAGPASDAPAANACGGPALPISQIQGRSLVSPLVGQRVAVEAVVTRTATTMGGVFLQEEQADRDGDALSSEALFVVTDPTPLAAGMRVRAEGIVAETGESGATLTTLSELGSLLVCGKDTLPDSYVIEQAPLMIDDWEALEHMRVSLEPAATVLDPDLWWSRSELLVSLDGRQFAPTEVALPGDEARTRISDNQRSRLVLSPGELGGKTVQRALPKISKRAPWRVGTELRSVSGIFSQRGAGYRILLTDAPEVVQAVRPDGTPKVDGELRLMSFNTLNLFNGDGKGGAFPTPRGASVAEEWTRQVDKHVAVLAAAKADVIALMEVENDTPDADSAEAQLLRRLNKALGKAGDYVAVATPVSPLGGDQIRVGIIYRKSRVEPGAAAQTLLTAPFDQLNRPPLLQTFTDRKSKEAFTVVALHLKSKGGCDRAEPGNHDREDGQSCFNAARVDAARALADWLDEVAAPIEQQRIMLLGDFNAHAQEDPIRLLAERGYARVQVGEPDYSFVYNGESGSLDHALASTRMRQSLGSAGVWHINADESQLFDYQADDATRSDYGALYASDPFRSSDHDPLLVGLNLATQKAKADPP